MMGQARRLGLAHGKTLILDDMEQMSYVFDLAIHTAEKGRIRTIDRYLRSAELLAGSDEALTLEAMARGRFALVKMVRRHPLAGLIVADIATDAEEWLVDLGLEMSIRPGQVFATRWFKPESFAMTAGVIIPAWTSMLKEVFALVPALKRRSPEEMIEDRRFAEAVYRLALTNGMTERVQFKEVGSTPT